MARPLSIIGAPSSAGAYAAGQEKAPDAFRRHGIAKALSAEGVRVIDRGNGPPFRWRPDPERPKAMNLYAVKESAAYVADEIEKALSDDHAALVLGGDCTAELGVVAGSLHCFSRIGLIYIDFDVDLTTPETSDGALDWTGVAHLLDLPGAEAELSSLGPRRPMLGPDDILYFAAENITPAEAKTMRDLDLSRLPLSEVKADPARAGRRAADWMSERDAFLVHLDVDVLTYIEFPIAENTRRCNGLALAELSAALAEMTRAPNWRVLTVTEVNPDHAPDEDKAFSDLIGALTAGLGGR